MVDNDTLRLILPKRSEEDMEYFFAEKAVKNNPAILDGVVAFEKVCYALNKLKPNFETFEPLPIICIAKAVSILNGIVPDWKPNSEISRYIAYIAHDEGWFKPPNYLSFAAEELNKLNAVHELDEEQRKLQELKHEAVKKYVQTEMR